MKWNRLHTYPRLENVLWQQVVEAGPSAAYTAFTVCSVKAQEAAPSTQPGGGAIL